MIELKYSALKREEEIEFPMGKYIINIWGKKKSTGSDVAVDNQHRELFDHYKSKGIYLNVLNQTHEADVVSIKRHKDFSFPEILPRADALISDVPREALCIKTADCMPSFFYSLNAPFFGAVHSGWRGLHLEILQASLGNAQNNSGRLNTEDLHFYIGPHIGADSYETREDVYLKFPPDCSYPAGEEGKRCLDMEKILKEQFKKLGVPEKNINWKNENTYRSSDFFSHRNSETGRNFNIIYFLEKSG